MSIQPKTAFVKSYGQSSKMITDRKKPELIKQALHYRAVYGLNAGGRKQKMSVFVAVGNGLGKVGIGMGKAKDTSSAVAKAVAQASKGMLKVGMRDKRTVYHPITVKFCASRARIMPAPAGSGMKCSDKARLFLECLGIKDVSVKIWGRNPINCIKALSKGLSDIISPREIAARRGVSLFRVLNIKPKKPKTDVLPAQEGVNHE